MLRFVTEVRTPPEKREAAERRKDFAEIYRSYAAEKAAEQASRCAQCGVPFCQIHCPLSNAIPDWLKLAAEGRLEEAYALSQATNAMPEICGRICPQDRLCEGNCTIEQSGHGTVTIGAIEKFLTDLAWRKGWVKPLKPRRLINASVGIIGAGPAGLAAAEYLRLNGYKVTVYDRHDRAGGLLTYGIPNFKLEKSVVRRRVERLKSGGIKFRLGVEIGTDLSFAQLRAAHDAVFIASGAYRARTLDIAQPIAQRTVAALDYLIAANRRGEGETVAGIPDAGGKTVLVIGGGDTAMDCVRTAIREGARTVTCVYRRDRANMPGSLREVANAEEEGVAFEWLTIPAGFAGTKSLEAVRFVRARLGLADSSGRRTPEPLAGSDFTLKADLVISALGFDVEDLPALLDAPGLAVRRDGRVVVDDHMTSMDGVFAGGDAVRGASLVVWAIRDGRDAAAAIHGYLQSRLRVPEAAE